ncbi:MULTISPECIES: hypothetical protein [unclassified Oerskovia]|uniref:hypothetical protein n=1 Tax=unclassified Oerskovia TaxID=2619021 RepID=UPI000AC327D0|nr:MULTISPECIES: hypothetical protein [unclassified Oerskovia]
MSTPRGTRPPTGATPVQGRPADGAGGTSSGRPTSRTLRVRRVVALVLLAVIVVGVVMLVKAAIAFGTGLLADEPHGKVAPPPPQAVATGGYKKCEVKDLTLGLTVSKASYADGENPSFSLTLTHVGRRPCFVDASPASLELVVTSGEDRIWSSVDCPPAKKVLLMAPGDAYPQTVDWARVRSAAECPADLPAPGAGDYSAVVASTEVAGLTSAPVVFTLLAPPPPPVETPPATEAPVDGAVPPADGAVPPAEGDPAATGETAPDDGTAPADGAVPPADGATP